MGSTSAKDFSFLRSIQRHIFICGGKAEGGCCSLETGTSLWEYLKSQLKVKAPGTHLQRSCVKCLRVCADGPIAVVYPEGTWYRLPTKEAIDTVIDEHLIKGEPVRSLQIL